MRSNAGQISRFLSCFIVVMMLSAIGSEASLAGKTAPEDECWRAPVRPSGEATGRHRSRRHHHRRQQRKLSKRSQVNTFIVTPG